MFAYLARFTALPGHQDELADLLVPSKSDPGSYHDCVQYQVFTEGELTVWVVEQWESKEAHDATLALPAIQKKIELARALFVDVQAMPIAYIGGIVPA